MGLYGDLGYTESEDCLWGKIKTVVLSIGGFLASLIGMTILTALGCVAVAFVCALIAWVWDFLSYPYVL